MQGGENLLKMSVIDNIQFKQCNSGNYQKGRTSSIKYIVIHYTANSGDTAKGNADYFARTVTKTSAHYFVDNSSIWQSVKDSDTAWAVGASKYKHPECRNANSISIEMCNAKNSIPEATFNNTVELTKKLMKEFNIPASNVLRHWDVTGKSCPLLMIGDNNAEWNRFKSKLVEEGDEEELTLDQFSALMDQWIAKKQKESASSWSEPYLEWAKDNKIMVGDADANQMPQAFCRREELATMLKSFYENLVENTNDK